MKVTLENFRKIQEYKKLGLSQKKTATNLSLTLSSVRKWWDLTEEDLLSVEKTRAEYLDNYKEFMLSQLHTCPQIKVTNLFFKLKETFTDFECSRSPFYKYVQKLRYDYGYDHYTGRQTTPRKPLPPGYEAQVDFGQFKMKDMYDRTTRVYFFCMGYRTVECTLCTSIRSRLQRKLPYAPMNMLFDISEAGRRRLCMTKTACLW